LTPWCWWPQPAAEYADLYLFAHGDDFRGALADLRAVSGKIPLMPRWALGTYFSRWFAMTDFEERDVLARHAASNIPLDVQVIDTDWHHGWKHEKSGWPAAPPAWPDGPPPDAQAISWTGWDINSDLLPAAKRLHAYLHDRGVATMFNLHLPPYVKQSGGVQYIDSAYAPLAAALGHDTSRGATILGDYSNLTWVRAFFDIAVAPVLVGLDVDARTRPRVHIYATRARIDRRVRGHTPRPRGARAIRGRGAGHYLAAGARLTAAPAAAAAAALASAATALSTLAHSASGRRPAARIKTGVAGRRLTANVPPILWTTSKPVSTRPTATERPSADSGWAQAGGGA
jgi:hypothetical protein